MLYYLIYVSKATESMGAEDLLALLDVSRAWNQDHDLTGMLIFIQPGPNGRQTGRFMQILEGSETDVKEIFDKIKIDGRHDHVTLLNEGQLKARNFSDWRMGFESITAAVLSRHPGLVELSTALHESFDPKKFNFALNFLKSFYELRSKIC